MKCMKQIVVSPKLLMHTAVVILVLLQVSLVFVPARYMFEGTLSSHRLWFKHGYLLSYLFFNGLFPLLYGCWLWGFVSSAKRAIKVFLIVIQTATVVFLQQQWGYQGVSYYSGFLALVAIMLFVKPQRLIRKHSHITVKFVNGSFLFIVYVLLCAILPRVHPFAKYTMFNKFPDVTYVYLLRNESNELVPIAKYSKLGHDVMYPYSLNINERHGFVYGNNTEKRSEEQQMCNELMQLFIDNLKPNHPPFEMLTLYKATFSLQYGKPVKTETPLCAYVVE